MSPSAVEVALPFQVDRTVPPQVVVEFARQVEASGVIDYVQYWEQLTSWWPRCLWEPGVTPLAETFADSDSFPDAFLLGAMAAAATERLGVAVSTDAIRRGPAELWVTMLTLAAATEGRALLLLGAGELKQVKPFGYKRSEGLARFEDQLRLFRKLATADGPFDFEGNHWKFKGAWVGGTQPHKPRVLAMGGGPQFLRLATQYADGIASAAPNIFTGPEEWASEVASIKKVLEKSDRDPDAFTFGLWFPCLIVDDEDRLARVLDNPLIKYHAAVFGRTDQRRWADLDLAPTFPLDWHYALKLLPATVSRAQVRSWTENVTRRHVQASLTIGSPAEVASTIGSYVEAGATWIQMCDWMQSLVPIDELGAQAMRGIEVGRALKQAGSPAKSAMTITEDK